MSYFKNKNNIISINLNQSSNCCLYSYGTKDLVHIKSLQTTYYLLFSMLLFPSILTFNNLNRLLADELLECV